MTTASRERVDTHSPKNFDPAEYREVGMFDQHYEDGFYDLDDEYSETESFEGNMKRGRCDHCGAGPLRYGIVFYHAPSDRLVHVGRACASKLGLSSRTELEFRQRGEQVARERKVAEWAATSPDNAAVLAWFEQIDADEREYRNAMGEWNDKLNVGPAPRPKRRHNEFVSDVKAKLRKYGSLSEKQVEALLRAKAREEEFEAKKAVEAETLADVAPLAEGRYEIEGEIVSHKWSEDTGYGSQHKMLVKLDDGNKVFGTIPETVERDLTDENGTYTDPKGARVRFTAAVERSRDDEHFGFFKRPTKAAVVS